MTSEFDLIERIRRHAGPPAPGVVLGIGDDAAVMQVPAGKELVATTDTLNVGVHFLATDAPEDIGHKALAVNLSDLAAMGAEPRWLLLSLTLPESDPAWLDRFIGAFLELAAGHGACLVGGDTCSGSCSVSVTALGLVDAGSALRRNGAKPGDLVVVSGPLGSAGWALSEVLAGRQPDGDSIRALRRPQPRVSLGQRLAGLATSCVDLSDGLLADLGHVARASGCGAVIELAQLPAREALRALPAERRWSMQLTAGDDYELCFTLPAGHLGRLAEMSAGSGLELAVVGHMTEGSSIHCLQPGGQEFVPGSTGFQHFR